MAVSTILGRGALIAGAAKNRYRAGLRIALEVLILSPSLALHSDFWRSQRGFRKILFGKPVTPAEVEALGQQIQSLIEVCPNRFSLLRIEVILSQLGLFRLAYRVKSEFWRRELAGATKAPYSARAVSGAVFASIWFGDVVEAVFWAGQLKATRAFTRNPLKYAELMWFVSLWTSEETAGTKSFPTGVSPELRSIVSGRSVEVIGPAARQGDSPHREVGFVTIVNGLGEGTRLSQERTFARKQVLYWTPEDSQKNHFDLTVEQTAFLASFELNVQLNGWCSGICRSVHGRTSLVAPWGLAHKAQVMVLDALKGGAKSVFVTGVDFYTGERMYAKPDTRGWLPRSLRSLSDGMQTDWDVKQAYIHALHDGVTNRRLLVNLFNAGIIDGDEAFQVACLLTDDEYLGILEEKFGKNQVREFRTGT